MVVVVVTSVRPGIYMRLVEVVLDMARFARSYVLEALEGPKVLGAACNGVMSKQTISGQSRVFWYEGPDVQRAVGRPTRAEGECGAAHEASSLLGSLQRARRASSVPLVDIGEQVEGWASALSSLTASGDSEDEDVPTARTISLPSLDKLVANDLWQEAGEAAPRRQRRPRSTSRQLARAEARRVLNQEGPLAALPAEIMVHVFTFLRENPSDLCRAACVCSRWNAASSDDRVWEPMVRRRWRIRSFMYSAGSPLAEFETGPTSYIGLLPTSRTYEDLCHTARGTWKRQFRRGLLAERGRLDSDAPSSRNWLTPILQHLPRFLGS